MDRIRVLDNPLGLAELEADDGAVVIVVEHGMVVVARYHAPAPPDRPHPAFERADNADALGSLAYQAVLGHFPGTKLGGNLRVYSCPEALQERAIWPAAAG